MISKETGKLALFDWKYFVYTFSNIGISITLSTLLIDTLVIEQTTNILIEDQKMYQ